ncbi:MAG: hypothetical protein R6U55_04640 [Desulfovermiculus sp.]
MDEKRLCSKDQRRRSFYAPEQKRDPKDNSGGLAVLGLEPVLEALTMGQVHTLLVDHNFQVRGTMCSQDRTLSTYLQTCPVCGQAMQQTDDLVEEIVQEAILQNAEINHVFMPHEEFSKYRIGAFLRFAL